MEHGYIRPQISRGEGLSSIKWEPRLLKKATPNLVIIPMISMKEYYEELFKGKEAAAGLTATIVSRPRIPSRCIPSGMKHTSYLSTVIGAIEVTATGTDLGICLDIDGFVAEGLGYNLFIVIDGILYTPPLSRDLLPGITREVIIEVARRDGYKVIEGDFDAYTLCTADEVFICSSVEGGTPVVEVDGKKIGDGKPGPITRRIGELVLAEMDKEAAEFSKRSGG